VFERSGRPWCHPRKIADELVSACIYNVRPVRYQPPACDAFDPAAAAAEDSAAAWRGIRTILVPQDIVGVRRRSSSRVKSRTPVRIQPDGAVTERSGDREWFSDRLFVEAQDGHARAGYGTSVTVHIGLVTGLIAFLITRPDRVVLVDMNPLVMPAIVTTTSVPDVPEPRPTEPPSPKSTPRPPAAAPAPAPPAPPDVKIAAAPTEAPSGIAPETHAESRTNASEVEGGVVGGVSNGVPGGAVGGVPGGVAGGVVGGTLPAVVRVGPDMQPPRKIRDVKPVYPAGTLQGRTQGAVILEATIGPDGKVRDAKVVRSVPLLDAAAIDAVRQWEYTPSFLNGVAIAVVITVVVNFAMQ
jgi:periplasmic protein TonB